MFLFLLIHTLNDCNYLEKLKRILDFFVLFIFTCICSSWVIATMKYHEYCLRYDRNNTIVRLQLLNLRSFKGFSLLFD
jgi:hypothetical protein